MQIDWPSFLTVWAFIGANVLSPGPNVMNTITTAMGSGRAAGLAAAAGVGVGIIAWCLAMSLGAAALFAVFPVAQTALRLLGAALLIWFASRYLRSAWRGFHRQPVALKGVGGLGNRAAFLRSLSVIALNPKALTTWLFVLSIFPVVKAGPGDIAVLAAGTVLVASGIHALYALLFSTRPAAAAYLRAAPYINCAVGLFFLFVATELLLSLRA